MNSIIQDFTQKPISTSNNISFNFKLLNTDIQITSRLNENDNNSEYLNIVDKIKANNQKQVIHNILKENKKTIITVKKKTKKQFDILFNQMKETDTSITIEVPEEMKLTQNQTITTTQDYDRRVADTIRSNTNEKSNKQKYIKASSFYLNNRKVFVNFIHNLFSKYINDSKNNNISCKTLNEKKTFSLMSHQNIVREYISTYAPYRGLLLFHGLGSGKTCSSIAIAEGLKSDKQIIVMTPASLETNYLEELKSCGDIYYKKQQFWKRISISNSQYQNYIAMISPILSTRSYVWVMEEGKESNYNKLTPTQQRSLNKQLNEMIKAKYTFIHYNGLNEKKMNEITENKTINPFDNKVVIVDEAHNLVSRIVNKLNVHKDNKKKKKNNKEKKKKVSFLSIELYEYLLTAENVKIIFLSGTPIINYPHEAAVMFNILRGYITTFQLKLDIKRDGKHDTRFFETLLNQISTTDYVYYVPSTNILTVTKNPFGFSNIDTESTNYKKIRSDDGNMSISEYQSNMIRVLEENNIKISNFEIVYNKALPDDKDSFESLFIQQKQNSVKFVNTILFKRRILGLVSYFRSSQEQLMPRFDREKQLKIVEIEMSDYQFERYNLARQEERKTELKHDQDTSSTYRIFSRSFCNFVFPKEYDRPLPSNAKDMKNIKIVDENTIDAGIDIQNDADAKEMLVKDNVYKEAIKKALIYLDDNKSTILNKENLHIYSRKFCHILENIQKNNSMHLVYSQFRTFEGIGIFRLVLLQHGFSEFKLEKQGSLWKIKNMDEIETKPSFVLYTGTESKEEKEIIRNVLNSNWNNIPSTVREQLVTVSDDNVTGSIIQICMISSSGAEGISLRNINYVHIMEPYWHPVRVDQVIGRARRICSHEDLPKEKQFVDVYLYMMKLTEKQMNGKYSKDLYKFDKSKLLKTNIPYTTDQTLHEISTIKRNTIENITTSMKESAIDCLVHKTKENLNCYAIGASNPNEYSFVPSYENQDKDEVVEKNMKNITWKGKKIVIDRVQYIQKLNTNELYTILYGEPKLYGYLKIMENGEKRIESL